MLIEASVFQQLGLMDNRYFVYYDDTDFMLRALRANKRLYYLPSVSVRHKVSSLTGGNESDFVVRYTARNRAYFWRKHLGLPIAFLFLTTYICYYFCLLVFQKIPYPLFLRKYQSLWEGFHLGAKAA